MVMSEKVIAASRFKALCLALIDDVAASGDPIVVTKRGRPVVRVVPVDPVEPLAGSVTFMVDDAGLIAPIDEAWDADRRA